MKQNKQTGKFQNKVMQILLDKLAIHKCKNK